MAKMLFAFTGWLFGYDGHFLFDNIGDSYIENKVPYVGLRSLSALLGSLTVPVVFMTMRDSGYGLVACVISASMILFGTSTPPPLYPRTRPSCCCSCPMTVPSVQYWC
jgi:dolichyl-phosphate-mannose-protein mannosyltransferase